MAARGLSGCGYVSMSLATSAGGALTELHSASLRIERFIPPGPSPRKRPYATPCPPRPAAMRGTGSKFGGWTFMPNSWGQDQRVGPLCFEFARPVLPVVGDRGSRRLFFSGMDLAEWTVRVGVRPNVPVVNARPQPSKVTSTRRCIPPGPRSAMVQPRRKRAYRPLVPLACFAAGEELR